LSDGDHVIIGGAVIRFRRLVGRPSTRSKLDSKAGSEGVGPQADLYSLFRLARIQAFLIASGPSPRRFPVNSDRVRVGRHLDCDIVLDHSSVSDHHAEIVYTNEGFHVVDRDSALGTFVAGVAVRVARLYHRAYLRLGKEKGLFVMRQMEREPPEPSFQLRDQLSEAFPERAPLIQQTFKDSRQEALDFAEQLVLRGVLDAEEWWAATRDCEGTRELARRWQPWAVLRWRRRRS
jgi:hypothetical protein